MKDWIEVTDRISLFAELLRETWDVVRRFSALSTIESFVSDWRQANWEQLVEVSLPGTQLVVYDGGADMYPDSSRVFRPDLLPTHIVVCTGLTMVATIKDVLTDAEVPSTSNGLAFGELGMTSGGGFAPMPPFDHVRLGDHVTSYVFALPSVRFWVRPILPDEI